MEKRRERRYIRAEATGKREKRQVRREGGVEGISGGKR